MGGMLKWKVAGAGALFCAFSAFAMFQAAEKSGWSRAQAVITSVTAECAMKSTERHIGYKTISEATVPCDMADAFEAYHADKSWTRTETFKAELRVTGAGGETVETKLDLSRDGGRAWQRGDRLVVLQNPVAPLDVAKGDTAGVNGQIAIGSGIIGAILLAVAFVGMGKGKQQKQVAAPALDEEADARASLARADALIAAALAERNKPATVQAGARTAQTASPAMRPYAEPAGVGAYGGRAAFGRRK
jgi:hypothetical protein